MGTPEIALPCLERLLAGPHGVVGVVSQPDRRRGRGRRTSPSAVSQLALDAGLPLLRPERISQPEILDTLTEWAPDLGVVVAFGQFIPKRVRELPKLGYCINAHASLLPKYRGAAPITRALLAGEQRSGISVMRVDREMDAGPVGLVRELEIGAEENAGELTERMAALAADAIEEAVARIDAGSLRWSEQDCTEATLAPKIGRSDSPLDWSRSSRELVNQVRALAPKPGATTTLDDEVLRILAARPLDEPCRTEPGRIITNDEGELRIATGSGWLVPLRVQRAGGKELEIEAFLRGRPIADGTLLGAGEAEAEGPGADPSADVKRDE